MRIATLFFVAGLGLGGVVSSTARAQSAPVAATGLPLEGLAARAVLVLPARYAVFADTMGWAAHAPKGPVLLATLDSLLGAVLRDRGLQSWRFADDVTRAAKRNAGLVADPHLIAATPFRAGRRPPQGQLPEPLASQLRSLIALNDARQVLIPVEFRTVNVGPKVQPVLRIAVIDARGSQLMWIGEVVGPTASVWSDDMLSDLATRVANLIVAP